jgi:L-fucose isomerase-like protein
MRNVPEIKLGLVAVSRDCFPIGLSKLRRDRLVEVCGGKEIPVIPMDTIVENENDVIKVLGEIDRKGVNALAVFLGNFGPEGPISLLAQKFTGPVMLIAAGEESGENLVEGRGDAYCGLLSASYNMGLRRLSPYIPESPVGDAESLSKHLADFTVISRIILGVRNLKIFTFGPRPQDFYTCHAPLQPLFDLGVEVMENSELDLLDVVQSEKDNPEIRDVAEEMSGELGDGNTYPDLLTKLAQYEVALKKFHDQNLGMAQFGVFANKCWPSFEKFFGYVPCYVNSRLSSQGIPVACEADIFGVLSEYMALCATLLPPTLLDVNNNVPADLLEGRRGELNGYAADDLWMGFHCGNTCSSCLVTASMRYQLIMHRLMEPGKEPDITRGTLEGQIRPGPVTIFRIQASPDTRLMAYLANGEVLNIGTKSFGSIGVFAVKGMGRFYRHVLLEKRFPHHAAVAFQHAGKYLYSALKVLGLEDVYTCLGPDVRYPSENPFS